MSGKARAKYKFKKNDQVQVMFGKDRGKTGRLLRIDRDKGRVVVEGLNMVKKTMKPKGQQQKGGISSVEAPLAVSNVQILCKKCGPTRIGYRMTGSEKVRVCRKCGGEL
jgi:large subunit ribosomal protein L24